MPESFISSASFVIIDPQMSHMRDPTRKQHAKKHMTTNPSIDPSSPQPFPMFAVLVVAVWFALPELVQPTLFSVILTDISF